MKLAERMKEYEKSCSQYLYPYLPICARLDGKCFSSFCKGLIKPYDPGMIELMKRTTTFLVKETQARIGYTQSDEISLIYLQDDPKSAIFFNRKIQKMISILSSLCTYKFNKDLQLCLPNKAGKMALFDARVWQVPTLEEATNVILWREIDATKNSITSAAQSIYSDKQLYKKNSSDKQDMLMEKGINWNNYPPEFKRGIYIQKQYIKRKFSYDEISKLPKKHQARKNPDLEITRTEYNMIDMPPFNKVINKVGVIFNSEEPIINDT